MKTKRRNEIEQENFSILCGEETQKYMYDTHMHDHYEFYFLLSDNVTITIENQVCEGRRGDFFIISPYTFHSTKTHAKDYKRYHAFFSEKLLLAYAPYLLPLLSCIKDKQSFFIHLEETEISSLSAVFNATIENKMELFDDYYKIECIGRLLKFILENRHRDSSYVRLSSTENEISKILEYLYVNASELLTTEEIAVHFQMSRTKLYYLMKNNIGISPKEYITKIRLSKAMELLKCGTSITETARLVGFSSYIEFHKIFKKFIGVSPRNWKCV